MRNEVWFERRGLLGHRVVHWKGDVFNFAVVIAILVAVFFVDVLCERYGGDKAIWRLIAISFIGLPAALVISRHTRSHP